MIALAIMHGKSKLKSYDIKSYLVKAKNQPDVQLVVCWQGRCYSLFFGETLQAQHFFNIFSSIKEKRLFKRKSDGRVILTLSAF